MTEIRHMSPDEAERLRELDVSEHGDTVYKAIDGRVVATSETWHRPRWSQQECGRRIQGITQRLEAGDAMIGAFDQARLVGLAIFRPELSPGMSQLAGLWVSKSHRRQGVATQLCQEMERLAQEAGAAAMYVSACPSKSAVGFYRSRGFRLTQDVNEELCELEPEDVHMVLGLGSGTAVRVGRREGLADV